MKQKITRKAAAPKVIGKPAGKPGASDVAGCGHWHSVAEVRAAAEEEISMSDGHEYRTTEEPSELRIELPETEPFRSRPQAERRAEIAEAYERRREAEIAEQWKQIGAACRRRARASRGRSRR